MEVKDYRIVETKCYNKEENLFLAKIELAPTDESEGPMFVSLVIVDDSVEWRVDDYDHCEALLDYWDDKREFPEGEGKENYEDFEETEESAYRIFFCMINNMWGAANTAYHVVL